MDQSFESTTLRECAFGLIDPAFVEFVPNELTIQPLVPERFWSSRHLMPILLDIRRLSDDARASFESWFRDTSKDAQSPPIAFFITANIDANEFSRHWNAIQLAQPMPTRRFWLRIHDPRVMHQLLRILNPGQRRHLFGRTQFFHYWLGGKWITAARHSEIESSSHSLSVGLPGWDWGRIEKIGIVNRALLRAEISEASELATKSELAEKLIDRAVAHHRLTEQNDLVEFAAKGVLMGPDFDEHPAVANAIGMTANSTPGASLADHFALIEEHVWQHLTAPPIT